MYIAIYQASVLEPLLAGDLSCQYIINGLERERSFPFRSRPVERERVSRRTGWTGKLFYDLYRTSLATAAN